MEAMLSSAAPSSHLLHCCLPSTSRPAVRAFHPAAVPLSSRRLFSIRASLSSSTSESVRGPTLSGGWDIAKSMSAGPWMPSMEELDPANMLLRQRVVFLGSQVDTDTADLLISQLLLLDAQDHKKDIKMFINSPGGSINAGMAIYDVMKHCKADISTVCLGLAASMGAFLLAAGTKGKRYCMPNARVMIHQPQGSIGGRSTEICIQIREMMYSKVKLNKILSRITGKPEEQIDEDTATDKFLNPWEAKEYGLIDTIIDDGKPGLIAPTTEPLPPPKNRLWPYFIAEGRRKRKIELLPSEQKFLKKEGGSDEKGQEQVQEPSPV